MLCGLSNTFYAEVVAALSVSLGSLVVGFTTAWSAPATAALQQPDSKLQLSDTQASWVGSAMPLAALLGGLAAGPGLERLGRRTILLYTGPVFCLAGILVSTK